jgi:hypothetical protein
MRRGLLALGAALILALAPASAGAADYYRVSLTRVDQDIYRDRANRLIFVTRWCYEYVYGDDAILVWEGPSVWGNTVIFSSGTTCNLKGVYRD